MTIPENLPADPYAVLNPDDRWRPGNVGLLPKNIGHLMPPLVDKLRRAVKQWRDDGYPKTSATTRALLQWWFGRDGKGEAMHYYFAQREAAETVIYLCEAADVRDKYDLLRYSAGGIAPEMMDEEWRRYAVKMATGSGKTKVISLLIAWSYFHKLYEENSPMSRNILLIAPNIIVLDRLYRDFEGMRIFYDDRVLPDDGYEGRDWQNDFRMMHLHKQNEVRGRGDVGNLFLTNIHRVYMRDASPPSPDDDDASDYFMGAAPSGATNEERIDLGEVVRDLDELAVINDEAHHIHDQKLAWFKAIEGMHNMLVQKGRALSLQVDMTATPKHNNGAIFPHTVADYPLVEAIHQNIVKRPVIPDDDSEQKMRERTSADYGERFADYIELGVKEWRKARDEHKKAGKKAVLFVMTDDTKNCDTMGEYLQNTYHDLKGKVLVIHTQKNGDITEKTTTGKAQAELDELRKQAATIDEQASKYCAIVSVLVLREGWDVRNVTTVVGLRAFSAKSDILPEQTLGRGLRLMYPQQNDAGEKVSVIGSSAFIDFVKKVEKEGVRLERKAMNDATTAQAPVVVFIDRANKDVDALDIPVPVLSRRFSLDFSKLRQLRADDIPCTALPYKNYPPDAPRDIVFRDMITGKASHRTTLGDGIVRDHSRVVGYFARRVMATHRFFSGYDFFYETVRDFIRRRLFGKPVDMDADDTVRNLAEPGADKAITEGFARAVSGLLTAEKHDATVEKWLKVSDMRAFPVSPPRNAYEPRKSAQNLIIGDSALETDFAAFLDNCPDVAAFAKNYFAVNFRLDYVRTDGIISNYFPDFIVRDSRGGVWIVETKGRKDENDIRKESRLRQWCEDAAKLTPAAPRPLLIDEENYRKYPPETFGNLAAMFAK